MLVSHLLPALLGRIGERLVLLRSIRRRRSTRLLLADVAASNAMLYTVREVEQASLLRRLFPRIWPLVLVALGRLDERTGSLTWRETLLTLHSKDEADVTN